MSILMFLAIGWLLLVIIVAAAANARGRSAIAWFFLAVFFSPIIAGFLLLLFPPRIEPISTVDDRALNTAIRRERRQVFRKN